MKEIEQGLIIAIKKEAERIEEDCMYSSKAHYNDANIWETIHLWIGIPTAILAALASASAFQNASILAGSISIIVTALTALATFLNPSDKAISHKSAASQYKKIQNQVRAFKEIDLLNTSNESELLKKIKEFAKARDDLNASSLSISKKAYMKAKKGIQLGEATYTTDLK